MSKLVTLASTRSSNNFSSYPGVEYTHSDLSRVYVSVLLLKFLSLVNYNPTRTHSPITIQFSCSRNYRLQLLLLVMAELLVSG